MNDKFTDRQTRWKEMALQEHERLARLFRQDRFKFELERKNAIEEIIKDAETEERRSNLRKLQRRWDNILKNAGSSHNRLVLIQMFFWDNINDLFLPALDCIQARKK